MGLCGPSPVLFFKAEAEVKTANVLHLPDGEMTSRLNNADGQHVTKGEEWCYLKYLSN